jgi:hypothetical protein
MKRIGLFIILLSVFVSAASAATISIGNGTAEPGKTVVVPLMINDVADAGSVEVNLTYNPSVVIPINIINSDFDMPPQDLPVDPESGYIIINAMQFATGLNGNVKIGDITLRAIGDEGESSPLNLADAILQDMAMRDIPAGVISGTFTIPSNDAESGGSGNGGSSGGGSSSEAYTNIVLKETRCIYVSKDELTSYKFEKPMNDIVYVNFTAITWRYSAIHPHRWRRTLWIMCIKTSISGSDCQDTPPKRTSGMQASHSELIEHGSTTRVHQRSH